VCDGGDDKCGFRNGDGDCTSANAGSVCRSGVCGGDGKCGFRDGEGACTSMNAATRCRSAQCDAESGMCGVAPGCSEDADCDSSQYCDVGSAECVPKLDDGVSVPEVEGQEPGSTGSCTAESGKSVCKSGVCDERDNRCGFGNDGGICDETSAETVCRSGACGGDGKCGYLDAEGSCTSTNALTVCRSGMCAGGVCGPALECEKDQDCASSKYCDLAQHACTTKKADGKHCVADNQCKSDSCSSEAQVCNSCIGDSCGKLKLSGGGCSVSSAGTTHTEQSLLLIALSAVALALRVRRRQRARV
jgi:MYXO-CTERM domain-containing protein